MKAKHNPFKNLKLDAYEQEIEDAVAKGDFKPLPQGEFKKQIKEAKEAARYTLERLKKTENINIRLSQQDLNSLKKRALEAGLPYQTLVAAVLHQFANKKINASL